MKPTRLAALTVAVAAVLAVIVAVAATRERPPAAPPEGTAGPAAEPFGIAVGGGADPSAGAPDLGLSYTVASREPSSPGDTGDNRVSVTGTAIVESAPDRSEWSFGVQTTAGTAQDALRENTEQVRALIAALRRAGVGEDDLQTQQVSIWPQYREDRLDGYTVTNSVRALVRQLDRTGEVVDAAVQAGANQVSGPMLSAGDRDALYRQALATAFAAARANAQALAQRAGASLGGVVSISESGGPPPVYATADRAQAAGLEAASAVPIEPGKAQISASVNVTFELTPAS